MSDYITVNGVDLRVGDSVRVVQEGVVTKIDRSDCDLPFSIKGKGTRANDWIRASACDTIEVLIPLLAVGDMIVHKEFPNDPPKEHRKIEALLDFNGQPHLVCAPWGGYSSDAKIIVPVADYVRAKI